MGYKVGDRVKRVKAGKAGGISDGELGTVESVCGGSGIDNYDVKFDSGKRVVHWGGFLEPAAPLAEPPRCVADGCDVNSFEGIDRAPPPVAASAAVDWTGIGAAHARYQANPQGQVFYVKVDDGEVSPYEKLKARVAELEGQLATTIQAKTNFGDICGERDALRRKVAELESVVFKLRGDLVRAQGQKRRVW